MTAGYAFFPRRGSLAAIALCTSLFAAGCATSPSEIPGCYEGPCVALGETQRLTEDFSVTPLAVLSDSRCPIEAECVWAGELRINARLDLGHETFETELVAYKPFAINGGVLTLAEVAPDASGQWPDLAGEDYGFRFTFEPKS